MSLSYIQLFNDINSVNISEISDFYRCANIRISGKFPNPDFDMSNTIKTQLSKLTNFSDFEIKLHLKSILSIHDNVAMELATGLWEELRTLTPTDDAAKSFYIKIVYWLYKVFRVGVSGGIAKIYIENSPSKQELYLIYLLSKLGNQIVLVDRQFDNVKYAVYKNIIYNISKDVQNLNIFVTDRVGESNLINLIDGTYKTNNGALVYVSGLEVGSSLWDKLIEVGELGSKYSHIYLFKNGINNLTYEQRQAIPEFSADSIDKVLSFADKYFRDTDIVGFIQSEFSSNKKITSGMACNILANFINLYKNSRDKQCNVYVIYGKITKASILYLKYLAHTGRSIIFFDVTNQYGKYIDDKWEKIEFTRKLNNLTYPIKEVGSCDIIETTAKIAQNSIHSMLYSDESNKAGIYRENQLKSFKIKPVVLSTTLDEIALLRDVDAKIRTGFDATGNIVSIPVIFAKLSGYNEQVLRKILNGDNSHTLYSDTLSGLYNYLNIQYDTKLTNGRLEGRVVVKTERTRFILDIEEFRQLSTYRYKHLPVDKKEALENAIQNLLDKLKYVGQAVWGDVSDIIQVALGLKDEVLNNVVWHDYTGRNPKLIFQNCSTETLNKHTAWFIRLIHNLGWDIIMIVPTGYSLGDNLSESEYIEHTIGEYRMDFNCDSRVSNLVINSGPSKGGWGFLKWLFDI